MVEKSFKGKVKAKIIEVRFASAGKLAVLNKQKGDRVKKGELIASLDKKINQFQLEKELADFEKVRAEFEIFNLQKGEPTEEIGKYLKSQKQAQLNASVKAVEVAKAELDKLDLFSPVSGVIIQDSDLIPGMYLAPASSPFKILDPDSFFFELEIKQTDLSLFAVPSSVLVKITAQEKAINGKTRPVLSDESGKFKVEIELQEKEGLLVGLEGEAFLV